MSRSLKSISKEVSKLKNENCRLKKMLERTQFYEECEIEVAVREDFEDKNKKIEEKTKCPECDSKISRLILGKYSFEVCDNCKFRQRL